MSKFGLAMVGLNSYFREGERLNKEAYDQKVRNADLSVLDDRTAATRSGYQNTTEENAARAKTRPGQTANTIQRQGLDATSMAAEAERQPVENQTRAITANMRLSNAQNDQANLPMSLQVKNDTLQMQGMTTSANLKQLPAKLARAATQGVIDEQGQMDVVLGTLGQVMSRQDKAGALSFANEVAKNGNVLPGTNGMQFTDIMPVRKGQGNAPGDGYVFVTADGKQHFLPVEVLGGAMQSLKSDKYKFLMRDDGSIFAGSEGTGRGGIVQEGDPSFSKSGRGGNTPASLQEAQWVMQNKDNPAAMAAWKEVRALRGDRRQMFIESLMKKGVDGQETQEELSAKADMYGRLFDEKMREAGGGQGGAQRPAAGSSPWKSMLE